MDKESRKGKKALIKPIPKVKEPDSRPIKGFHYLPFLHGNVGLLGRTGAGKTTVLYNIVKNCIDKNTKVFLFCSSINLDDGYTAMLQMLEARKIPHMVFTSLIEPETRENILDSVVKKIEEPEPESEEDKAASATPLQPAEQELPSGLVCTGSNKGIIKIDTPGEEEEPEKKRKPRKSKYQTPKYCIIMDDLSKSELRSVAVINLLKKSRRFAKVIISSQFTTHVYPDSYSQMFQICLWGGFNREYIKRVYEHVMPFNMNAEEFFQLYMLLTAKKYKFMTIDMRGRYICQDFNRQKPIAMN
jgi:hypothetical protein